jgi:TM2 domain-containing membrane protein YozV
MAKRRSIRRSTTRGSTVYVDVREVNWVVCLVMSIIFGWLGVDRFIMGKVGTGLLKLITLGGLGVWWLVDLILIATKHQYKNVKWID